MVSYCCSGLNKPYQHGISNTKQTQGPTENTLFTRLNTAALTKFFMTWVQCLFEGGIYTRVAFIKK